MMRANRMDLARAVKKKWQGWIERRIPASNKIKLSQRSIFIVPSLVGVFFSLLLVLLLVTASNYQNSLIFALTFWLFSIAISAMIFTYKNLSGLIIKTSHAVSGFSGSPVEIPIRLQGELKSHQGLMLSWPQKDIAAQIISTEVDRASEKEIAIPYILGKRGYLKTNRIRIESRYPFGLYKTWTWLRLNTFGVVYPKPMYIPFILSEGDGQDEGDNTSKSLGNDEFLGLRSYQAGDPMKHIAWKYLAKGKGLLTKEYDNQALSLRWLDWHSLQGKSVEERLSYLTGWVLQAESEGRSYGLILPNVRVQPDSGDKHREQCLRHLALFNIVQNENTSEITNE